MVPGPQLMQIRVSLFPLTMEMAKIQRRSVIPPGSRFLSSPELTLATQGSGHAMFKVKRLKAALPVSRIMSILGSY